MPLGSFRELEGHHFDDAVLLGGEGDVDAFVDGEAGDFAEVVVRMRSNWANSIWAEGDGLGVSAVYFNELIYTFHTS